MMQMHDQLAIAKFVEVTVQTVYVIVHTLGCVVLLNIRFYK